MPTSTPPRWWPSHSTSPHGKDIRERLKGFSRLLSSNLLEAELRAAFAREQQEFDGEVLSGIDWILPDRPLAAEMERTLAAGYLRGADLWHVATALFVALSPAEISFVTLDGRQRDVASALGFQVRPGWTRVDCDSAEEDGSPSESTSHETATSSEVDS